MNRGLSLIYDSLPVSVQNALCTADGYRRFRRRFTPHFRQTLDAWTASAHDPIERQRKRQWEALKRVMALARENSPYYRFLPDPIETGDAEESLHEMLKTIPPLEKSVYRARTDDFLRRDMRRTEYNLKFTSGTTGSALRIFDGVERFAENYAVVWRQRNSYGVWMEDPFMAFTGQLTTPLRQQSPPFWRHDRYSRRTLFSIYHMSPENLKAYIDPIFESPARYAEGYPSALHLMGTTMIDEGRCLPKGRLKAVFTSSESLLARQRETIETAFGAPVRDHYGSTEHVVSMAECIQHRLHVDMEFGIVEVETKEETPDWVRGPLIVTALGRPAAPMIRYRIGDIGTRSKHPCPCGRPGETFLDIDGRIEDYVLTNEGRMVGRLDHVFKGRFDVAEAQILQTKHGALTVKVVPSSGYNDGTEVSLRRGLRGLVGRSMQIDIELVDQIDREPNGKFRAVRSTLELSGR
jgi:phenylacetate-CoA ligase